MKCAKRWIGLLLSLAMVLPLAACGGEPEVSAPGPAEPDPAEQTEPRYGGELVLYFQEFTSNFDPSIDDRRQYALWFEPLFAMDWSREDAAEVFVSDYMTMEWMTGQLAEDYQYENGDLTVYLRTDVCFQDKEPYNGRPLVSGDVKWTYDRLLGIGSGYDKPYASENDWSAALPMVESIECPDEHTVVFHFNTDSEVALNTFITTQVCIGGPEWDELTTEQQNDWHYAAGTGPYILEDYSPDNYMTFVRNENYYDHDERYPDNRLPYLDRIKLQFISDSTQLQTQFIAGNIDVMSWGNNLLNKTEIELLEDTMNAGDYVKYVYDSGAYSIALKQTIEPFRDIRVRQAMQLAIPVQEIHEQYFGYTPDTISLCGMFSPNTQFSSVDQWSQELYDSYHTYDPERAKELLAEAGYPDGFSFDFIMSPSADADLFALVSNYLAQVGIQMNITVASSSVESAQVAHDPNTTSCYLSMAGATRFKLLFNSFRSGQSGNTIHADDPYIDEMLDRFNTVQTLAEQEAVAKEVDEYFAEQHYVAFVEGADLVYSFVSDRVGGYAGERLWKNWNTSQILARIWVIDGTQAG